MSEAQEQILERHTVELPTGRGTTATVAVITDEAGKRWAKYDCNETEGCKGCGYCISDMAPIGLWLGDIRAERFRQELDWPAPAGFNWSNADRVLMEEVGEVAKAHLHCDAADTIEDAVRARDDLRAELVQVAAVACRWIELIDDEIAANKRTHLAKHWKESANV